jgi:hypothetical protein
MAPILRHPLPSPVTVDKITANKAKPRPISAAKSSSTIGSSGALDRRMKVLQPDLAAYQVRLADRGPE